MLTDVAIRATGWGWRHSGRRAWAVRNLDLALPAGSRTLLLGPSGAGKSTLLHGLAGLLSPEEGESEGDLVVSGHPAAQARGLIALLQQDPDSQIVMETIGDEVAFGCENLGVPADEIWPRVREALALVGLDLPLDHPSNELSGGQKQRLALAAALAMKPEVLLLDEPTANLDPEGAELVRQAVSRITDVTIVVIEHRVETWVDLADHMVVLSPDGILAEGAPAAVLAEQGAALLEAGIWVPGAPLPTDAQLPGATPGPAALTTANLSVGYRDPVLRDLDLSFPAGVSTCITGPNGAGKTTLALTLAGLLPQLSGRVETKWGDPHAWRSRDMLGRVGMVFQEPSYQFVTSTVAEELALGPRLAGLDGVDGRVTQMLERMQLTHLAQAHPLSLSGGEKRRLSVATALICAPKILILDEPTFGQDRNTWAALVQILREVVEDGTTVITISHDAPFVAAVGQETLVVQTQVAAAEASPAAARQEPRLLGATNPLMQLLALLLVTVPLFLSLDLVSAAMALGLELIIGAAIWGRRLLRAWPLLIAALLAAVSMLLYARPGGDVYWTWGPASVTENSVQLAAAVAVRVLAIGLPAVMILGGLRPTAVADSLTQVGRVSPRPVFATLAGFRLMSLMFADWQALQRARRSRGVGDGSRLRAFFRNSLALLTFALRRAGTLSTTMEARGFGADIPRTHARHSSVSGADVWLLLAAVAIPVAALGAAVAAGTFRWFGL